MENERKRESILTKIKNFFKRIFRNNKVKKLPKPKEEPKMVLSKSKEEYLKLYQDIKDKKINVNTLSEEDLKVLIALVKQEINYLDKKIDNEKTECNMYRRKIEYYKNKSA